MLTQHSTTKARETKSFKSSNLTFNAKMRHSDNQIKLPPLSSSIQ